MDSSANATIGFLNRPKIRCTEAPSHNKCVAAAIFASIFFFLAGQPFIPLTGIQNDEAIFAGPLYEPLEALYSWRLGVHHEIPLMLMSYLGCLKTLLYAPLLKLFGTGVYAVREPALLFGALSVWLFFLLLDRIAGSRAALVGCWLLAADSLYLLTICYDWGPVALQHLLIVAGALSLVEFYQTRSNLPLALGFLLFGLALWDKALAIWMLSGFGIAGILTFPRQIFAVTGFRRCLLSAAALALGALPLISYNLQAPLATIRENTDFDTGNLLSKLHFVTETARGGALLGFWNAPGQTTPAPHSARGWMQTASAKVASLAGDPRSDLLLAAFLLSVLLAPLAGRKALRSVLFFLIAMTAAWFQMAINPHTGGTIHHTILLWPWPEAVIAISWAAISENVFRRRGLGRLGAPALACAAALVIVSSLLVTNEYYAKLVRNGGSPTWSAAVFPLAERLKGSGAAHVFCTDWGYLDTLILLTRNQPPVRDGIGPVTDAAAMQWALGDPSNLFVEHSKEAEVNAGSGEKFAEAAAKFGRGPRLIATIADGYGRNIFNIYRFQ